MEMAGKDGIVHLWDLPRGNKVYVRLKGHARKKLLFTALKISKTYKQLRKILNTSERAIGKLYRDETKSMSIDLLERFSKFLAKNTNYSFFKLDNLERRILYLRSKGSISGKIFNPHFPLNFNCPEGGRIIGCLMGDGGIRKDYRPFYSNKDVKRIKKMVEDMKKVIGKFEISNLTKINSPTKEGSITYSYDFYKILGYILCYGLGMVPGGKNANDPQLPEFSFNTSINFKINLLKSFFTDESTPHRAGEDLAPQITLRQVKIIAHEKDSPPKRLVGINRIIKSLGISAVIFLEDTYVIKGEKRGVYNLSISRIGDARRFSKMISFFSEKKSKKLNRALKETKRKNPAETYFQNKRFNSILPIIKSIRILAKENKSITSKNIGKIINRPIDSVKFTLGRLVNLNLIKLKDKGKPLNGKGHSCDKFELTLLGKKLINSRSNKLKKLIQLKS